MIQRSKIQTFLARHPELEYDQLDGTLKAISRITETSPDTLLAVALIIKEAELYLVKATLEFQAQITS